MFLCCECSWVVQSFRGADTTVAESTFYTIRAVVVVVGWSHVHISKISSATILPPITGLIHPPQLTLSHDIGS